jgi:VanZ family protein
MKTFAAILWLLTLSLWGLMLLMTHGSPDEVPQLHSMGLNDRVDHFLAFGLLGGLLSLSLWALFPKRPLLLSMALPLLLAYAAVDEVTRTETTSRVLVRHWLADAAGAAVAVTCMYLFCGLSRVLRRSTPIDETIDAANAPPRAKRASSGLGLEVEAALASYTDGDAEVGEQIIRVEKALPLLPGPNPVRAKARRRR